VSNFFFSLILQHIYIKEEEVISFDYYPKYINTIKKEKIIKKNHSKRHLLVFAIEN